MIAALLAAAVAISTAAALQPRAAGFASLSAPSTRAVSRWAPSRANPTSVPIPRRSNLAKASRGGGLRACAAGVGEFPVLLEWLCARNGFVHTGLALAEDDGGAGRGLVATRAIKKGEQMIVVPRAAQLCVPQADEDAQLLAVDACGAGSDAALAKRGLQRRVLVLGRTLLVTAAPPASILSTIWCVTSAG